MKAIFTRAVVFIVLMGCILSAAGAGSDGVDRFCGVWTGEGVCVEIRREDEEILCRALFQKDDGSRDVWEYCACRYDEGMDALECGGIIKRHEDYNGLLEEWTESDWLTDDFYSGRFEWAESVAGLMWSGDGLDTAVELIRWEDDGQTPGVTEADDE